MILRRLELCNFRNIAALSANPGEGVNILYGENAQGKTNVMEAIWLFTGAKSFRTARDSEVVRKGEAAARLDAAFFTGGREQTVRITIGDGKQAWINGVETDSVSELAGRFCCVVFSPVHMGIVKGGPAERRRFLDTALCQLHPSYITVLREYGRVLAQRNALLKDISYSAELLDTLDTWDQSFAGLAARVYRLREPFVRRLSEQAEGIYRGISSGREPFSLSYRPGSQTEYSEDLNLLRDRIAEELRKTRAQDLRNGSTAIGPHRDELEITVGGMNARAFGSQGQQRSCVLALKLGEGEVLRTITGVPPVILLDDVMSELDHNRRGYILNSLTGSQIFITCCEKSDFANLSGGTIYHITDGNINKE